MGGEAAQSSLHSNLCFSLVILLWSIIHILTLDPIKSEHFVTSFDWSDTRVKVQAVSVAFFLAS